MRRPRLLTASLVLAALALTACGDDGGADPAATSPTELQIKDITVGTGPAAKAGDLLLMRYVGTRTADGTEFDQNVDSGEPLNVTLGAGQVIQGWDEGLVGIQQGGRRQLDIPADLAYGDSPPAGSSIQPGDALTFVVDAVAVIATPDPADRPDITVEGGPNVTEVQTVDLVTGSGAELAEGQTAIAYLVAFRADTGEELLSSWDTGSFEDVPFAAGQTIDGLYQGMTGMRVGGRRQITIPFASAFGADGNADLGSGLPPNVDLVLVVEVFGAY